MHRVHDHNQCAYYWETGEQIHLWTLEGSYFSLGACGFGLMKVVNELIGLFNNGAKDFNKGANKDSPTLHLYNLSTSHGPLPFTATALGILNQCMNFEGTQPFRLQQ